MKITIDIQRLVQFMRMTEVTCDGDKHDGEALNALRMANRMLRAAGKNWGDVLAPPPIKADTAYRTPPSKRGQPNTKPTGSRYGRAAPRQNYWTSDKGWRTDDDIELMLIELAKRKHEISFLMFLASVRQQFEEKGGLTNDQYAAVKRAFDGRRAW